MLHGPNGCGKTSVLRAAAKALNGPHIPNDQQPIAQLAKDERKEEPVLQSDVREGAGLPRIELVPELSHARQLEPPLKSYVTDQYGPRAWIHDANGPLVPFAFYDIDRNIQASFTPVRETQPHHEPIGGPHRWRPDYSELWEWFYARENSELRQQRECRDFERQDPNLTAIRKAIEGMVEGATRPRIESDPLRLVVDLDQEGTSHSVSLEQLSDGYRSVLALAADLAWRMANMDPLDKPPLTKEMIVLIDEIELHLHPAWQQRILTDLMRTFPKVQFIVSTHSPQVLTTVEPQHIINLCRDSDGIVARSTATATYGAEAGEVLECEMGVGERPDNAFSQHLRDYLRLISLDRGKEAEALELRDKLNQLSPKDPALDVADLEIRQRELFRKSNQPK